MSKLDWTMVFLIAALPVGCAGKLDSHQDFFGDRTSPALKANAAGSGSGWASAGSGGARWQDAGASETTAQAGKSAPPASSSAAGSSAPKQPAWTSDDDYDAGTGPSTEQPAADSGSSNAKPDAGAPTMAAACDFKGIVQAKCGNPSCHGSPASTTGLDLTSAGLAMRIDGRKGASACTDKLLIDKEHPEDSMLYLKVTGSSCGVKMPLGGSLTASEQACFLTWIEGL